MIETWIDDYELALLASAALVLMVLVQSLLGALFGLVFGKETPGGKYQGDYSSFGFRALRTYQNSTENFSVFAFSVLLAMIAGASPALVNFLAAGHVGARFMYWLIYYMGLGPNGGGPRTLVYVVGWGFNVALAVVALMAFLPEELLG